MRPAREQRQHAGGVGGVLRLAEDRVVQHDLGVGAQHGARRKSALQHPLPADGGLGARDALDVVARRLGVARAFDDVALALRRFAQPERSEFDAELAQQLLAARALRGEVDGRSGHGGRDPDRTGPSASAVTRDGKDGATSRLTARYSCSATTTRTSPCGNVSAESATMAAASRLTDSARPSALPITNATSRASSRQRAQVVGQHARRPRLPALVERDHARVPAGGRDPQRLGREQLRRRLAAIARLGLQLDELQRELARHPARVVVPAGVDPGGHPVAERDDAELHRWNRAIAIAQSSATSRRASRRMLRGRLRWPQAAARSALLARRFAAGGAQSSSRL